MTWRSAGGEIGVACESLPASGWVGEMGRLRTLPYTEPISRSSRVYKMSHQATKPSLPLLHGSQCDPRHSLLSDLLCKSCLISKNHKSRCSSHISSSISVWPSASVLQTHVTGMARGHPKAEPRSREGNRAVPPLSRPMPCHQLLRRVRL